MTNKLNLKLISTPGLSSDRLEYGVAVRLAESEVSKILKAAPLPIRRQMQHLAQATGKGIRAQALLACSMESDGLVGCQAINAAASIELLHLATLIHDDIIDNADMRRGIDALHVKFGEKTAVLCGDYLFCFAFELASTLVLQEMSKGETAGVLPSYFTAICLGEIREFNNIGNFALTENEYLRIISGKTAALFQASFHIGFLLSDEPPENEDIYVEIGRQLGMVFQLADDCLDYISSEKKAKKPVLSDCRCGVITLPLIYALQVDKSLRGKMLNGISEKEIKSAVLATGGIEYTQSKIREFRAEAKKLISSLENKKKRIRLEILLDKAATVVVSL